MQSYEQRKDSKSINMRLDSWGFQSPKRALDQALPLMLRDSNQESSHPILSPMERGGSKGDILSQSQESFSSTGKTTHLKFLKSPQAVEGISSLRKPSPSYQILKFFEKNHDDLLGQISFKRIQDDTFREVLNNPENSKEFGQNISKLAEMVRKKSKLRYESLKRHQ